MLDAGTTRWVTPCPTATFRCGSRERAGITARGASPLSALGGQHLRYRSGIVGLLAAAAGRPQVTFFGGDAYLTFEDKAAALLHSLARNHALLDGNERLAWSVARVFCLLNGRELTYAVDQAEDLMLSAASGQVDVPQIAAGLLAHSSSES